MSRLTTKATEKMSRIVQSVPIYAPQKADACLSSVALRRCHHYALSLYEACIASFPHFAIQCVRQVCVTDVH